MVELLVTIMIMSMVLIFSGMHMSRILDRRAVQSGSVELMSAYQLAQDNAVNAIDRRDHGVQISGSNQYELISVATDGSTDVTRVFELPKIQNITGPSKVVFTRLDGRPDVTGVVTVQGKRYQVKVVIGNGREISISPPTEI